MTNIAAIVPHLAINIRKRTVVIELICTDEYAARVLYEDILSRTEGDDGLTLKVKGQRAVTAS